jgi:hypothetical protein
MVKWRDWRLERTWERSDVEEVFLCLYVHVRTFVYGFGYGFGRAQLSSRLKRKRKLVTKRSLIPVLATVFLKQLPLGSDLPWYTSEEHRKFSSQQIN